MIHNQNSSGTETLLGRSLPVAPGNGEDRRASLVDAAAAFAGLAPQDLDELHRMLAQADERASPFVACAIAIGLKERTADETYYTGYLSRFFAHHILVPCGLGAVAATDKLAVAHEILLQLIFADRTQHPVAARVLSELPSEANSGPSEAQRWLTAHLLFESTDFVAGGRAWPPPLAELDPWKQEFAEQILARTSVDRAAAGTFTRFMHAFIATLGAFALHSPIGLLIWQARGTLLDETIDLVASYISAIARNPANLPAVLVLIDEVVASAGRQLGRSGYVTFVFNLSVICQDHALDLPEPARITLLKLAYSRIATLEADSFELGLFRPIERNLGLSPLRSPGLARALSRC